MATIGVTLTQRRGGNNSRHIDGFARLGLWNIKRRLCRQLSVALVKVQLSALGPRNRARIFNAPDLYQCLAWQDKRAEWKSFVFDKACSALCSLVTGLVMLMMMFMLRNMRNMLLKLRTMLMVLVVVPLKTPGIHSTKPSTTAASTSPRPLNTM
jgi:hypothetical protein